MIVLSKIAMILSFALAVSAMFYALIAPQWVKLRCSKHSALDKSDVKTTPVIPKTGIVKNALSILSKNPSSKESIKVRLYASLVIMLLAVPVTGSLLFGLLAGFGAYFALGAYFAQKIKAKITLFDNQLLEALGMITNSVRAGQSFVQALENMVKDSKPPLSEEFDLVLKKIKLGRPAGEALLEMTETVKSNDLRISVISINLARESGGDMGGMLSSIADIMRERKRIQGKITALTAQGKASGIVMGCMPFILLCVLYFIQPGIMGLLFTTFLGNVMLAGVALMITAGMVVINKIVSIDI